MKEFARAEVSPQRELMERAKARFHDTMRGNVAFSLLLQDYATSGNHPGLSADVEKVHVEPYFLKPPGVIGMRDFGICMWSSPEHARQPDITLRYLSVGRLHKARDTLIISDELVNELSRVLPVHYNPQDIAEGVLLDCFGGLRELEQTPGLDLVLNDQTHLYETRETAAIAEIAAHYL